MCAADVAAHLPSQLLKKTPVMVMNNYSAGHKQKESGNVGLDPRTPCSARL
jgi:hypothetical protein